MAGYPSWRYHHTKPAMLVEDESSEPDPKAGWTDEPWSEEEKKAGKKLPKPPAPPARVQSDDQQPKGGYIHQEYPSWRYHRSKSARLVHDADEDDALDDKQWRDTPWPENEGDKVAKNEEEQAKAAKESEAEEVKPKKPKKVK